MICTYSLMTKPSTRIGRRVFVRDLKDYEVFYFLHGDPQFEDYKSRKSHSRYFLVGPSIFTPTSKTPVVSYWKCPDNEKSFVEIVDLVRK